MHRLGLPLALALVLAVPCGRDAVAQADYPSQPIRILVANTAGSATDNLGRVVAAALSPLLGQQVLIINQAGAGGTIGAEVAARAAPDGYTLFATSTQAHAISPHLYPKAKYKPLEDFVPITMLARTENVLVLSAQQPFSSLAELVAFAKANPGKLNMGNAGPGSQSHLAGAMFTQATGIDVLHVPYKGAASVTAVVGNEANLTFAPMPAVIGLVNSGRLKPIAVGGTQRSAVLPNLPTMAESGVKDYVSSGWTGFVAPKGTPAAVIDKFRSAIVKVVADPAVREALLRAGGEPWTTTPAEMWSFVADDLKRYGEVVRIANVKVE
jgi:tripartite-type tricarboxylate transporter receptor subunit TctC